jgi:hypothetical protein
MTPDTCLRPLGADRARELFEQFRTVQNDEHKGIALDDRGRVTGVIDVEDPTAEHVLGDFDVHA